MNTAVQHVSIYYTIHCASSTFLMFKRACYQKGTSRFDWFLISRFSSTLTIHTLHYFDNRILIYLHSNLFREPQGHYCQEMWSHYIFASFIVVMVLFMSFVVCSVFICLAISIFRTKKKTSLEEDERKMIRIEKTCEINYGLDIRTEEKPVDTNDWI